MIVIEFPELMTAGNWWDVAIEGVMSIGERQPPVYYLTWTVDEVAVELLVDTEARTISLDEATDPGRVAVLEAALGRFKQPPVWAGVYRQVRDAAQSAVGVRLDQLTAGQRNALLAILLWEKKAIGDDGRVNPLGQWVKRRTE